MTCISVHELRCNVLVAGGGPAGVSAAIAAARSGANVILCQDRPVLGGNASSEVRMHIVGADESGKRGVALATEARESGIIEEIRLAAAVSNPQRSASVFDLLLYDLCRREPRLTLMLNTAVIGAEVEAGVIKRAVAERISTDDRYQIKADVYIDCTGDGKLGAEAGARFRQGREATTEFSEELGQPVADLRCLGSTLLFQAQRFDGDMSYSPPPWARKFTEADLRLRTHATPGLDHGLEYGYWWIEWGGTLDTIKDNEAIRDELLSILLGVWDHVKNGPPDDPSYPNPDAHNARNWALTWMGFLPGKRESRRFIGQHVLNERDVLESRVFSDAIAYGGWSLDLHPPEGIDASDLPPCTQHKVPKLYDIPLSACVSANISNLMFAGRNISATHVAFASTRVMATCAVVGQGVGTAAAYAAKFGLLPANLFECADAIKSIQQRLLRDGAYLIGQYNHDSRDLARTAAVSASCFRTNGEASNVISGQTRSVHGLRGADTERVSKGSHRWMSDKLPAWLEIRWPSPVEISSIELTFDTGLHRILTMSHADSYVEKMQWGQPQEETVSDYDLVVGAMDERETIVSIQGNFDRQRSHQLDLPITTNTLRLIVHATQGIDHARIIEIRVYGPHTSLFQ